MEFWVIGIHIRISFFFLAVITFSSLIDTTGMMPIALLSVLLHEAGHIVALCVLGNPPQAILFEAEGIRLKKSSKMISYSKELCVLLSGCAVNFLLFLGCYFFANTVQYKLFGMINFVLGCFNLLPIGTLDGGRVLRLLLQLRLRPSVAQIIYKTVSLVLVVICLCCGGYLVARHNITMLLTGIYLFLMLLFHNTD